jgi:hypothetical protein
MFYDNSIMGLTMDIGAGADKSDGKNDLALTATRAIANKINTIIGRIY